MLVAQLDRVTGYEPVGRGFESLQARHTVNNRVREHLNVLFFFILTIDSYIKYML